MQDKIYPEILERTGGRHYVTLAESAKILGVSKSKLYHTPKDKLPFLTAESISGRPMVSVVALAEYLAEQGTSSSPQGTSPLSSSVKTMKPRRGRPTKAETLARQRAGGAI